MKLDVDDPTRSVDINAIYDNLPAAFAGESGAPKLQTAALDPSVNLIVSPTSGTSVDLFKFRDGTSTQADQVANLGSCIAIVSGEITVSFTYTTDKTGTGDIDTPASLIVKLLSRIGITTTVYDQPVGANETNRTKTTNITVNAGDRIVATVAGGSSEPDPKMVEISTSGVFVKSGVDTQGIIRGFL